MTRIIALAVLLILAPVSEGRAAAIVGQPAPAIELRDSDGKTVRLDAFKGKFVVLEWVNFQCPFVGKHYGSGNMQKLQKKYTEAGVVWLSVCSSAQGKQGYVTGPEAKKAMEEKGAAPSRFLLDPKGVVGKAYGAKTTPHMFVIDPKGTLVYNGAIDDKPSTDKADIVTAKNYLAAALDASLSGKKIEVAASQPYGCSVKY
ncbi:MAG TPA: thioredoxin family protein [Candidatus Eisenbacteria bacterium]|nr:thioredoxin family protein [Candidatus Eisenbacteria bacterium]